MTLKSALLKLGERQYKKGDDLLICVRHHSIDLENGAFFICLLMLNIF